MDKMHLSRGEALKREQHPGEALKRIFKRKKGV
jgi:hypothetical protein